MTVGSVSSYRSPLSVDLTIAGFDAWGELEVLIVWTNLPRWACWLWREAMADMAVETELTVFSDTTGQS